MSETNDIEEKLRELLGQKSERSPESVECAKVEASVYQVAMAYSRTVALLLNFKEDGSEHFKASYAERDAWIARAYDHIGTGLNVLESASLKYGASRESLVAIAEFREAMKNADVRSEEDFSNGKAQKALMLEFVIPSWKFRSCGDVSPSETVGKSVAAILH